MPELIRANAHVLRIEDFIRQTWFRATARGGDIQAAGELRLGSLLLEIDAALVTQKTATHSYLVTWTALVCEVETCRQQILHVRDDLWNELGRPRRSAELREVFPKGADGYASSDLFEQPLLLDMLRVQLAAVVAPKLTEDARQALIADLDAVRGPLVEAVERHRPTVAPKHLADKNYRSLVHVGVNRLRFLERDLLNLGLSRARVYDIIPDARSRTRKGKAEDQAPAAAPVAGSPSVS